LGVVRFNPKGFSIAIASIFPAQSFVTFPENSTLCPLLRITAKTISDSPSSSVSFGIVARHLFAIALSFLRSYVAVQLFSRGDLRKRSRLTSGVVEAHLSYLCAFFDKSGSLNFSTCLSIRVSHVVSNLFCVIKRQPKSPQQQIRRCRYGSALFNGYFLNGGFVRINPVDYRLITRITYPV